MGSRSLRKWLRMTGDVTRRRSLAASFQSTALCVVLLGFWRGDTTESILRVELIAALVTFVALPILRIEHTCTKSNQGTAQRRDPSHEVSQVARTSDSMEPLQVPCDLRKKVYRYLLKRTGNRADAEDLLQETDIRLWVRSGITGQAPVHRLRAFVFTVARNALTDWMRRRKRSPVDFMEDSELPETQDPSQDTMAIASARQERERIHEVLKSLPEETRTCFVLHRYHALTYEEIADTLNISRPSVCRAIAEALSQMSAAIHHREIPR
jgi:RNA polymerase sigma factor (sigma-70 family)